MTFGSSDFECRFRDWIKIVALIVGISRFLKFETRKQILRQEDRIRRMNRKNI